MKGIYEPTGRALEYSLLAVNLYRGCSHGCSYCYAPSVLRLPMTAPPGEPCFSRPALRPGILKVIERDAERLAGTAKRVLLCFTCDPYQQLELEHRITRRALNIFRRYDIPFQVLTKAGSLPMEDFDLYGPDDAFAVTLTTLSLADQRKWEPRTAPPAERIGAIIQAKRLGLTTWVSLEPVIDCENSLDIIKGTHEYVDLYKIGGFNYNRCPTTPGQWRRFGHRAIDLCRAYGKDYYIKRDLAKHLKNRVEFTNTDTRTVKRQ